MAALAALCIGVANVRAEMAIDPAQVKEIAGWLPPTATGLGSSITNRAFWDKLAKEPKFEPVIKNAEKAAKEGLPDLPDELYLDYSKTGNRVRCEKVLSERQARLIALALAECLENQGRFLGPLTNAIEKLCQEKSWEYPAHDGKLDVFHGKRVDMDLRATRIAWELSNVDYLLGDKLPAATRQLIRDNVRRRVLTPYRDMAEGRRPEIHWMRATHNWNAVCVAGVTGAALALEDSPEERAWFIAAAQKYLPFFLKSFTPDGYCSEGVGYWNYGFGHYLMIGETIRQATGGHVDLLADPAATQPALFCRRSEILNGIYPTISDCHPGSHPDPRFSSLICQRFGLPCASRAQDFSGPSGSLFETMLFSSMPESLPPVKVSAEADSPLRTWFKEGGVLISRPAAGAKAQLAVALKGGHNAENHNHNDVGSFSVIADKAMVICDPGSEVYTARTFGSHRYDSKVINSYGHAVPVVAGKLQQTGREAHAAIEKTEFNDDEDILAMDITSAYPVPELKRLDRTFTYRRKEPASLTVRDEVEFSEPKSFETALITWGTMKKISDTELLITDDKGAVKVEIDAGEKPVSIREEVLDEDVTSPTKPRRIGISLNAPTTSAAIVLMITPETK